MRRLVLLSDTHEQHKKIHPPHGDIIIHAGDFTYNGEFHQLADFADWFVSLPHAHKVFIAGNHDKTFEYTPDIAKSFFPKGVHYLENSMVELEGLKIWGSPVTPRFFDWAFNVDRGEKIKRYWDMIPDDTDILVTHGPARGYGDTNHNGDHVGCDDLLNAVYRVNPKLHVFGHIHEGFGTRVMQNGTLSVNAAVLDGTYKLVREPVVVEI